MDFTKGLMVVAVVAVLVAGFNVVMQLAFPLTGNAANDQGLTEVELEASVHIQFLAPTTLDWGAGSVNTNPAILNSSDAPFYDGGWTASLTDNPTTTGMNVNGGLDIENYGSVPVNLSLWFNQGPDTFVCDDDPTCVADGQQAMDWWLNEDSEAGSCTGQVSTHFSAWTTAYNDSSGPGVLVCDPFNNNPASNEVELDIQLTIPLTAPVGERQATINAEACIVGCPLP